VLVFVIIIQTSSLSSNVVALHCSWKMACIGEFQDFTCEKTISIFKVHTYVLFS